MQQPTVDDFLEQNPDCTDLAEINLPLVERLLQNGWSYEKMRKFLTVDVARVQAMERRYAEGWRRVGEDEDAGLPPY